MSHPSEKPTHEPGRSWIILAMLVIFMMLNFGDKAVIGLAAGPIMKDLHLTHSQFGEVGSAFFLLFSISAAVIGIAVNRVPTKLAIAVMAFIWAATQMPMLGVVSLETLMVSRIILGAGEGPAFPVALHAAYKWFPKDRRALPTSFMSVGAPIGIGILSPLLGWIIVHYSWHAAFGFLGVIGFLWFLVWLFVGQEGPLDASQSEAGGAGLEHVSYTMLLTSRTFIGVTVAGFAAYWAVVLAIVWMPSYMIKVAGYSQADIGWLATLPPMMQLVASPIIGFISQKMRQRGVSSRTIGVLFVAGSVVLSGVAIMALSQATGKIAPVPLAMIGFSICGVTWAIGPTLIGEVSPVHQRGAALGISNGLFTTAGLIAPWLMGHLVDVGTNPVLGFRHGFMEGGVLIVALSLIAMLLINPAADLARFQKRKDQLEAVQS